MSNPICNFSVDLSNLQNQIASQLATILNLRGLIGTPPGLIALQSALAGIVSTVQSALSGLLPQIPFASEFLSLRDQLQEFANDAVGDITKLLGDFAGILDIDANINLLDLANSAIRLGINFDPCSLTSGIPNIIKDPAGNLFQGPSLPPFLGATDFAERIDTSLARQVFNDASKTVEGMNVNFSTITNAVDGAAALRGNVMGSITGLGNSIVKLPSGESIFQSQGDFITSLKTRTSNLVEKNMTTIADAITEAESNVTQV